MPEIAWGGAIFVAPLGVLTSSGCVNLVNTACFVDPFILERIIRWIQSIFDVISIRIRHLVCT